MSNKKSFVSRIREQLDELSPSERRLADFALDFPGELAGYTASELAGLASVSNATVTRFIRRLGYPSYDSARRQVRSERQAGSPLLLAETQQGPDHGLQEQLQQAIGNLSTTYHRLSESMLIDFAAHTLKAKKVWLIGYRSNQALAAYLRWQLLQIVPHAQVIPGAGETLAEYFATINKSDVIIIFGLRRRVRTLDNIINQAIKQSSNVLFITDQLNNTQPETRWTIRCDVQSPSVLDNHVSVIALCHLLATYVINNAGTAGRRYLGTVEAQHDVFEEL